MKIIIKTIIKKILLVIRRQTNRIKYLFVTNINDKGILLNACKGLKIHIAKGANMSLMNPCFTNEAGCNFSVRDHGSLNIGFSTFFNKNCIIVARNSVIIGNHCLFGPNVYICDHDHLFDTNEIYTDRFVSIPVIIGDGTWVGAGCIILKGAEIGKNCIIGAGSVITGKVPDNTILVQKRNNTYFDRNNRNSKEHNE